MYGSIILDSIKKGGNGDVPSFFGVICSIQDSLCSSTASVARHAALRHAARHAQRGGDSG